jgi:hypothetical protein
VFVAFKAAMPSLRLQRSLPLPLRHHSSDLGLTRLYQSLSQAGRLRLESEIRSLEIILTRLPSLRGFYKYISSHDHDAVQAEFTILTSNSHLRSKLVASAASFVPFSNIPREPRYTPQAPPSQLDYEISRCRPTWMVLRPRGISLWFRLSSTRT